MDLTKELRGNEPGRETKRRVAPGERKTEWTARKKVRRGRKAKKERTRRRRKRPVERRTQDALETKKGEEGRGREGRKEGEREVWKDEGVGCGRVFEASRAEPNRAALELELKQL